MAEVVKVTGRPSCYRPHQRHQGRWGGAAGAPLTVRCSAGSGVVDVASSGMRWAKDASRWSFRRSSSRRKLISPRICSTSTGYGTVPATVSPTLWDFLSPGTDRLSPRYDVPGTSPGYVSLV